MSGTKLGDLVVQLKAQVSKNEESISELLDSNKAMLETVSSLEASISDLVDTKVNQKIAPFIKMIEELEKFRNREILNRCQSKLIIQSPDWTQDTSLKEVVKVFPTLKSEFIKPLAQSKVLVSFATKQQKIQFVKSSDIKSKKKIFFHDYIPASLAYEEYCLKKYAYCYKKEGLIKAYYLTYRDFNSALMLRVLKTVKGGEDKWLQLTNHSIDKWQLPPLDVPDLLTEDQFWQQKNSKKDKVGKKDNKRPRSQSPNSQSKIPNLGSNSLADVDEEI